MDDGPEQGGQDDYEPDVAARVASAAKQKAAKEYFLACCPSALRAMSRPAQFRYRGSQGLLRVNELGRRLGQGRSARRISAPAPGSGDRRAGQFALAKGKLHGLLSGAEP